MSSVREFVTAWNEVMPFATLNEIDIKNPNELLLRRWLIAILKKLHVNTACFDTIDSESGNALRLIRIRLTAYVNHFYKVANPTAKDKEFYYMDLIQPTYKKTYNVLRSILNYSAFVDHMVNKTIVPANEELKKCDELLTVKNQLKAQIEEAKIREQNNFAQIRELDKLIPRQRAKICELEEEEQKCKAEALKYQQECQDVEIKITEMRNELKEMKASIICDEESDSILNAKKQLEAQYDEQSQVSAAARNKLVKTSRQIEDASQVVTRMESLLNEFKSIDAKARKNDWMELQKLQKQVKELNDTLKNIQKNIMSVKQFRKCQDESMEIVEKKRDEYRDRYVSELSELKLQVQEKKDVLKVTQAEESKLINENLKLRDDSKKLYNLASNVVMHIANQSYDTSEKSQTEEALEN